MHKQQFQRKLGRMLQEREASHVPSAGPETALSYMWEDSLPMSLLTQILLKKKKKVKFIMLALE